MANCRETDWTDISRWTHVPVLYDEALTYLAPKPGGRYVDCTVGFGGHARGILERSNPDGRLLGIDADRTALQQAEKQLEPYAERCVLVNEYFSMLERVVRVHGFAPADGVLFDLGMSSFQVDCPERGFSFRVEAPLDMRFNPHQGPSASDLINSLSEEDLASVLYRYGEERRARAIARAVVYERARRPIATTTQLARIVERVAGRSERRVHPATRTFQALRIAVNRELEQLEVALPQALEILAPGGRIVVISFHSLEDRIVKRFLVEQSRNCVCPPKLPVCVCSQRPSLQILTRRPLMASRDERHSNPRSRSARLRAAAMLSEDCTR